MPDPNTYTFQPENLQTKDMYKLLIGSIVPRPIAWVSSQNQAGILNLAPFSLFHSGVSFSSDTRDIYSSWPE